MATLRKICTQLADSLNRPFDEMLFHRLADLVIQETATLLQQTVDRDGVDKEYLQTSIVPLKIVSTSETDYRLTTDRILRSVNKIHTPIRYKNYLPFIYIGIKNGRYAFNFTNYYMSEYNHFLPYIGEEIGYDYVDKYLYIFNNIKLTEIRTSAMYPINIMENFRSDNTDQQGNCYMYDMEFPIPVDMINILQAKIKQLILNPIDMKDKIQATHIDNN